MLNTRIRNLIVAGLLLVGFTAGCSADSVDSVIRSGSGDIVLAESGE